MSGPPAPVVVRVLHVEDDANDAELIRAALADDGFDADVLCVDTRDGFVGALEQGSFDVILSDFTMPRFDGVSALKLAHEMRPEVPFIFVSGTMGEEAAIDALHRGADDYVLKDRLSRLASAVRRSLVQAVERRRLREAELQLAQSEERFRRFMEASPAAAYMKDGDGRIVYVNRAVAAFFGRPLEEILGRTDHELLPNEVADVIRRNDLRVAKGESLEVTEMLPSPAGAPHYWSSFKFPVPDGRGGTLVAGMAIDITEKKRLEERYLHAQKMEAVGRLAGGVAHDFNNILTVIGGYSDLVGAALIADPVLTGHMEEIRSAAQRAAGLTRQLLAFSRQEVVQPVVLNVNDVILRMGSMLRRVIGEDVRLEIVTSQELGNIRADRGQMEQVLMNLVVNARDATPSGGTITVRTDDVPWEALQASADGDLRPGTYVMVSIKDTGSGMSLEVLGRIFEPFFTTKERGKGTGLGLATVHGIVKQNGGHIRVASEPGRGSTFDVFLPRVAETAAGRRPTTGMDAPPGGSETIVVAEDNAGVRSYIREVLQKAGYTILPAEDGIEAVDRIQNTPGPVDLLISDMVMPRMGGPDLLEAVRRTNPEMRALFLSGYADRAETSRIAFGMGTLFLRKPFTSEELLRKVRDVLDGASA